VKPFREALKEGPILLDGAMGSLLYERGVFLTHSYDELCLSQPALIRQVHADYLAAGAEVLETNTFGANSINLTRHGHSGKVVEINKAAVTLAREVARDRAWVAGAVGPSGIKFGVATEAQRRSAIDALAEQIVALVDAGVDVLTLETFASILELEATI
jgi:homocysteine S-methyltransferase